MPVITIDGPKLGKEQKKELIESFTQEAVRVIGLPAQAFVVIINETEPDNVGVGGEQLSEKQAREHKYNFQAQ
jgi:4-oxalocrotonate tautomerase